MIFLVRTLRVRAIGLAFEKFTRADLFQIALEIMWLPINIALPYVQLSSNITSPWAEQRLVHLLEEHITVTAVIRTSCCVNDHKKVSTSFLKSWKRKENVKSELILKISLQRYPWFSSPLKQLKKLEQRLKPQANHSYQISWRVRDQVGYNSEQLTNTAQNLGPSVHAKLHGKDFPRSA